MHLRLHNYKWYAAVVFSLFLLPTASFAQEYTRTDLVSSIPGDGTNPLNGHDAQLVNSWGMARSTGSTFWISDNGTGVATLYNGVGNKQALVVTIPAAGGANLPSTPTGIVANGTVDFALPGSTAAKFIFVTEQGVIAAWNGGNAAVVIQDNSQKGAIYKGCAIAELDGKHYLYVANFHSGEIEVYDATFTRVSLGNRAFEDDDDRAPFSLGRFHGMRAAIDEHRRGFAPFNIEAIGTNLYVAFAKQDDKKADEVDGTGLGFVEVFDPAGHRLAKLQQGPWFNAPWGMALASGEFGEFSHSLLVGMFGSGQIAAFNPVNGTFLGLMENPDGSTLSIDGLWALMFGAGNANSGPYNTLFFTAGPNGEQDGTFGTLVPVARELNEIDEP
jgi:uncharacterized protein (TIGR03118 family)